MDHFTSADTLDVSNFLRGVTQSNGSFVVNFLQPVTGLESNGQPVMPPGFDKDYGLYLTVNASGISTLPSGSVESFSGMNVTLWADPLNNDGTPSVSESSNPSFSNGTANDIVLATGTMVSASMMFDPTTMQRGADFVPESDADARWVSVVAWFAPARQPAGGATDHPAECIHRLPAVGWRPD